MWASPISSPSAFSGWMRASMQVTMATLRAGGIGLSPSWKLSWNVAVRREHPVEVLTRCPSLVGGCDASSLGSKGREGGKLDGRRATMDGDVRRRPQRAQPAPRRPAPRPARPARGVPVPGRGGRGALRRQGQVAAQARRLVLPPRPARDGEDGRPRRADRGDRVRRRRLRDRGAPARAEPDQAPPARRSTSACATTSPTRTSR